MGQIYEENAFNKENGQARGCIGMVVKYMKIFQTVLEIV